MEPDTNIEVDQVIIRKVGGYNLESVAWWQALSRDERAQMLQDGSAQFFGNGAEIDPTLAAASMEAGFSDSIVAESPTIPTLVWPPPGLPGNEAVYSRLVVAGPRWEVQRESTGGVGLLSDHCGRNDRGIDPYDLGNRDAARDLATDLLTDSLCRNRSISSEIRDAIDHFLIFVLERQLGNRAWQVSSSAIRATIVDNPYLELSAAQHDATV